MSGGAASCASDAATAAAGPPAARGVVLALEAMATRFELVLPFARDAADEPALRAVGEAALEEVRDCERRLSRFDPASLVSLLERDAARRAVRVDGDTFELLERCVELARATGGAFDVTVGGRMDALGFHAAAGELSAGIEPTPGAGALLLDRARGTVRFARPGVALDLGGVAKGHALDLAASVLREHGVAQALLHGGTSTAVALGAPPGADAWRVAIGRGPDAPVALLRDAALAVSAPHGRRDAAGAAHVLDPRSGRPVDERVALAAVIASSARDADAWSTALVAGAAEPRELAHLTLEDGRWRVHGSCAPPSRFELPPQHPGSPEPPR